MDCMQCEVYLSATIGALFQYRKRYGLHAILLMLCCRITIDVFQYRKRYGLHAINPSFDVMASIPGGFNTASGMDCMQ